MNKATRNVCIVAVNNGQEDGFHIYVVFSGKREYLTYHRHNGLLYGLLKDGIPVDTLRRWSPAVNRHVSHSFTGDKRLRSMVKHLLAVVDDYIVEREANHAAAMTQTEWLVLDSVTRGKEVIAA